MYFFPGHGKSGAPASHKNVYSRYECRARNVEDLRIWRVSLATSMNGLEYFFYEDWFPSWAITLIAHQYFVRGFKVNSKNFNLVGHRCSCWAKNTWHWSKIRHIPEIHTVWKAHRAKITDKRWTKFWDKHQSHNFHSVNSKQISARCGNAGSQR